MKKSSLIIFCLLLSSQAFAMNPQFTPHNESYYLITKNGITYECKEQPKNGDISKCNKQKPVSTFPTDNFNSIKPGSNKN